MTNSTMTDIKAAQALAILDSFDDSLRTGETIVFGRINHEWFARIGNMTSHGVTCRDALAQLAQALTTRVNVVLPESMTQSLRAHREFEAQS